jgi:hypothetical protein
MPFPIKWSKIEHLALAHYVSPEARELLSLPLNLLDLQSEQHGNRKIAERIYNALLTKEIEYALEPFTSAEQSPTQDIRTPKEILETLKEGTCLDLALLFAGLTLAYELIPVLIVLEGHALVAISLTHSSRSWNRRQLVEHRLFENVQVTKENAQQLRELFACGAYLAIECTGFARSQKLSNQAPEGMGRDRNGTMPFERAVAAGSEQVEPDYRRPFKFALDMAVGHYFHKMEPFTMMGRTSVSAKYVQAGAAMQSRDDGPLSYLLNRSAQEKALWMAALNHRALASQRPFLCLIHGEQHECHTEFVLRLREISIPALLEHWHPGDTKKTPLMKYRVTLPKLSGVTEAEWRGELWEELAKRTVKHAHADREQVAKFIFGHNLAVIVEINILAEQAERVRENIEWLINFWNGWPDLPADFLLVVCLSFKYQEKYETPQGWYQRLRGSKGINDQIREYLEGETRKTSPTSICLPELRGVPQSEAEEAVNIDLISGRYGLTERDVRGIYDRKELCFGDGSISMDRLLTEMLKVSKDRMGEKYVT